MIIDIFMASIISADAFLMTVSQQSYLVLVWQTCHFYQYCASLLFQDIIQYITGFWKGMQYSVDLKKYVSHGCQTRCHPYLKNKACFCGSVAEVVVLFWFSRQLSPTVCLTSRPGAHQAVVCVLCVCLHLPSPVKLSPATHSPLHY